MFRMRITTLLFILLLMMFTVRLGDFVVELVKGEKPHLESSQALAEEAKKDDKKDDAKKESKNEKDTKETNEKREEIPAKDPNIAADDKTEVKGVEKDPFMQEYSDEELNVLQNLSKRRDQLDQRERDLDQREKLLQAAEKKVDEKVAELSKLRSELEDLMGKQQKLEEARISQLVNIYQNMKPKDAANIFNDMDFDVLLSIIDKMPERKVAPIMAAMNPDRTREISRKLAEQRALPKAATSTPAPESPAAK